MQINTCDWRTENFLHQNLQFTITDGTAKTSLWQLDLEILRQILFYIPGPILLYVVRVLNNDQMLEIAPWVNPSVQKWFRGDESLNLAVPEVHCCTVYPPTSHIPPALPKIKLASSSLYWILSAPTPHAFYLLHTGISSFRRHFLQKCLNCTMSMLEVSEEKGS